MNFLAGKKTIIGGLLLSLSGVVWGLDQLFPGEWFTRDQYEAFAYFVGGMTGVAMRIGMASSMDNKPPPQ